MNTLIIDHLHVTYPNGHQAVTDISLEIRNGLFGLLGPNGAGKSTLMKTIAGLQKPGKGKIIFNGTDISGNSGAVRQYLGFLPQDFGVYPKVSAIDLLHHIAILKGIGSKAARNVQIESLLHKVNLYDERHREAHTFSGGMKQRFGVAQALLGNPQLIIVDEPTAGLDPEERNRFNSVLSDISREVIILLSTHLVEDVRNLCSEMAVMKSGRLLLKGQPDPLIAGLENKLWSRPIENDRLAAYEQQYHVISRQFIERKLQITVFSDTQPDGFTPVRPTLEHVYFHTLTESPS